jgi:hypothetical protein
MFPKRGAIALVTTVLAVVLLGYWLLMTLVPVPGYGAGDLSYPDHNFAAWLDRVIADASARTDYRNPRERAATLEYLRKARDRFPILRSRRCCCSRASRFPSLSPGPFSVPLRRYGVEPRGRRA